VVLVIRPAAIAAGTTAIAPAVPARAHAAAVRITAERPSAAANCAMFRGTVESGRRRIHPGVSRRETDRRVLPSTVATLLSASTITSSPRRAELPPREDESCPYLVFLTLADHPAMPSSRHLLDDVDEVWFGRGERHAARAVRGGRRVLVLRFPDPRMSADHGKLFRGPLGWVFEDLWSKNGSLVDGELTRRTLVTDGTVLELGHTCLLFCVAPVEEDAPADQVAGEPPHAPAGLATFDGRLAAQFAACARIAREPISVVLLGETGTGKELVARALHELSCRPGAFVAVNCGALPAQLVEAELFGSRKGAYTGAIGDRLGLVRSSDGGTLLLDEIGELPVAAQAILLRVLQEREVTPVGGDRPVKVDLRLCVATLRDLSGLVERGEFRRDLYARLLGFTLTLPPLRERLVDFGLILSALLPRIADGRAIRFAPPALRAMLRYDWPFNIRELERALASAVALATNGVIDIAQLPETIRPPPVGDARDEAPRPALSPDDEALRGRLIELLTVHGGHVVTVAKELGVRRTQIYRWLHRFGIELARFQR
jgi:Sigma-54 interaction domain/FHA domain